MKKKFARKDFKPVVWVGDTVYIADVWDERVVKSKVSEIRITKDGYTYYDSGYCDFDVDQAFKTRAAAEKGLKKLLLEME